MDFLNLIVGGNSNIYIFFKFSPLYIWGRCSPNFDGHIFFSMGSVKNDQLVLLVNPNIKTFVGFRAKGFMNPNFNGEAAFSCWMWSQAFGETWFNKWQDSSCRLPISTNWKPNREYTFNGGILVYSIKIEYLLINILSTRSSEIRKFWGQLDLPLFSSLWLDLEWLKTQWCVVPILSKLVSFGFHVFRLPCDVH